MVRALHGEAPIKLCKAADALLELAEGGFNSFAMDFANEAPDAIEDTRAALRVCRACLDWAEAYAREAIAHEKQWLAEKLATLEAVGDL